MTNERHTKGYCIDSVLSLLMQQGENLQVTLMHRFIYNHRNIRMLKSIHRKITSKLIHLRVLPPEAEYTVYDEKALQTAMDKLYNKN